MGDSLYRPSFSKRVTSGSYRTKNCHKSISNNNEFTYIDSKIPEIDPAITAQKPIYTAVSLVILKATKFTAKSEHQALYTPVVIPYKNAMSWNCGFFHERFKPSL